MIGKPFCVADITERLMDATKMAKIDPHRNNL